MKPVYRIKYKHSCFDMDIVQNVTDETIQAIVPHILKDFTDYNLSVNQGREFLQNLSEALGYPKNRTKLKIECAFSLMASMSLCRRYPPQGNTPVLALLRK